MSFRIDPAAQVGHVNLKVSDLERSIAFYSDILGFTLHARYGTGGAFLGAGGYHHHIGLNTVRSLGGTPPPEGHTGLHHVAFLYPSRRSLAVAVKRVLSAGIELVHKSDHAVSESVYFQDPDSNLIELYRDRPRNEWPTGPDGTVAAVDDPLDLDDLLAEAD